MAIYHRMLREAGIDESVAHAPGGGNRCDCSPCSGRREYPQAAFERCRRLLAPHHCKTKPWRPWAERPRMRPVDKKQPHITTMTDIRAHSHGHTVVRRIEASQGETCRHGNPASRGMHTSATEIPPPGACIHPPRKSRLPGHVYIRHGNPASRGMHTSAGNSASRGRLVSTGEAA